MSYDDRRQCILLFGERGCDLIGRYFGGLLDVVISDSRTLQLGIVSEPVDFQSTLTVGSDGYTSVTYLFGFHDVVA